ncbi:MAG: hypothetical protein MI824_09795 [Hyphomicrobiales bacterium]|nr:hypothetical protein [Hyphomicrobiales bacterium]MCG8560082.1 hypothetical protein [Hyphomicrobiales bacterium]
MAYIVLIAEAMAVGWLAWFTALVLGLQEESRALPDPPIEPVGRTLVTAARWALTLGVPTLALAETAFVLGMFD